MFSERERDLGYGVAHLLQLTGQHNLWHAILHFLNRAVQIEKQESDYAEFNFIYIGHVSIHWLA